MMGIGYDDSIILYNLYINETLEAETYFGTRFDNVRIELTQGANIRQSGLENADACLVKIPINSNLPKPYMPPEKWNDQTTEVMEQNFTLEKGNGFYVIVKKEGLGVDFDLPTGAIESGKYRGGYFQYIKEKYGHAYTISNLNIFDWKMYMPRYEVGGV